MPLPVCTSYEVFSYPKDNPPPPCDFDVISLDIDSNKRTNDRLKSSKLSALHKNRYSNYTHANLETNENGHSDLACNCKSSRLEWNLDLGCNISTNQDSLIPSGSNGASTSTGFPRYCIVSSNNNDSSSISRIFWTSNCTSQFSELSSRDMFMQNILLALQKAGDLSAILYNWDWTFGDIISPLLQMLESCDPNNISTAIITLLGQLRRLGVDAKGYQDFGVEILKNSLSTSVCQSSSRNFGLPIQFASVTALLGLIVRSFQEVV